MSKRTWQSIKTAELAYAHGLKMQGEQTHPGHYFIDLAPQKGSLLSGHQLQ